MCKRSQLPVCATTFLIPLVAYAALTSALFPNVAPPSALLTLNGIPVCNDRRILQS